MKRGEMRIRSLRSQIEVWQKRKAAAIADYDRKIADINHDLELELFLNSDSSYGSTLMRPHSERNL